VSLVRSVRRALAILRSFEGKSLQTLAEVTHATGLDKGTTRRLLITMMGEGFIAQDPQSQRYGLGRAIRRLAANVPAEIDLRAIAVPVLAELTAELHFTAFLSVYQDGQAVCLERVHDMKGMEVRWWAVGGTLPINCGGAPKVLLAHQDDAEIDRVLSQPLKALTPRSVTDPEVLKRQLKRIRTRGYEFAVDDVAVGLSALAVPILDREGGLVCCISLSGLTPQMSQRGRPVHLDLMRAAAAQIVSRLG
jgi:DNA-binding IclR family transcriptional regulator